MRKTLGLALALLLVCAAAFAQDHHHHDMSDEEFMKMLASLSSHTSSHEEMTRSLATVTTGVTVTINMTAQSFSFTPSTITVNQGDTVVLNLSVPANDPATTGHGILMDTYIFPGQNVARGSTRKITFTATQDGTFAFGCNISDCGIGHTNMIGNLIVKKLANPAPSVSGINPASGPLGGGTSVTITGANFQSGATVTFGGTAATNVSVTSSTTIVATTPAAPAAGPVPVVVANPDGQSVSFDSFTYNVPPPAVTGVSPATGPNSGGTTITISGNGFAAGARVFVGIHEAGRVAVANGGTTITALTPLGVATEEGGLPVDVVVVNPDGTRITKSGAFIYFTPPLAVSSVSPSSGLPSGGSDVTITGTGFTSALASSVTFGGVPATSVRVVDPVTMHVTAPAHALGSVDVVVTVGANSVTVAGGYNYANPGVRKRAARH